MNTIQGTKLQRTRPKNPRARAEGYKPADEILAQLKADRENHLKELERLRAALVELPEISVEEADPAVAEHAQMISTIQRIENHLVEIDQAIQAAQSADYGICEDCGEPIDPERLKILPETRLCIKCKRASEKFKRHHTW